MRHLRALKILNFVMGGFTFVLSLVFLVMFVLPGILACRDGEGMGAVFVLAGLLFSLLLMGIAALHWVVGQLVGVGRGRVGQTMLAIAQISTVPVGTAYALYALYICWLHEPSKRAFDAPLKPGIH